MTENNQDAQQELLPKPEPAIVFTSIAEVLRVRARLLADKDSVSDEEIKAARDFTRDARTAQTGAKTKTKATKKAASLTDIFG